MYESAKSYTTKKTRMRTVNPTNKIRTADSFQILWILVVYLFIFADIIS